MDSIISWNIAGANGLLGRKTDDPDFVKIINGNDVICLQETVLKSFFLAMNLLMISENQAEELE